MADFADSTAVALDVELLAPAAAGRLLESNLYAICELVAGRAARASSARQYRAIYTRALAHADQPVPTRRSGVKCGTTAVDDLHLQHPAVRAHMAPDRRSARVLARVR